MFGKKKDTVSDFLVGLKEGAHISADIEGGWVSVKVDDNLLFEGTITDSMVVYISLMKLMGKKSAKKLLKLRD